jgi:hypothetical protein
MEADKNIKQQLGESINRKHIVTLLLFLFLLVDLLISTRKLKGILFLLGRYQYRTNLCTLT